jgi:hypothetical protein
MMYSLVFLSFNGTVKYRILYKDDVMLQAGRELSSSQHICRNRLNKNFIY